MYKGLRNISWLIWLTPSLLKKGYSEFCFVFPAFISDTTESSSDNIGVIAGSVTGVFLLVAVVVAGILLYKKYQHN